MYVQEFGFRNVGFVFAMAWLYSVQVASNFRDMPKIIFPRGHKEMSSFLADQKRRSIWAQKWGEGGECGVSAMSTGVHMEPK